MTAAAATNHQTAKPEAILVFRERCEARCLLVSNGLMTLQDAVDGLQETAVSQGLLKEYGQDEIQQVMAESFARWQHV